MKPARNQSQRRAFWFSLVVHVAVLSIMVFTMRNAPTSRKRTIDLDLSIKKFTEPEAPPPPEPEETPPEPQKAPELPKNVLAPKTPGTPRQAAAPAPPMGPQTQSGDSVPIDAPENSGRAPFQREGGYGDGGDGTGGAVLQEYFKEQFSYIWAIVMQRIKYPDEALNKGMQGKVLVSFVVMEDGNVKDIKILSSSGYTVLDKNAMDTVRIAAPFPRPPANAELQLPINYVLES